MPHRQLNLPRQRILVGLPAHKCLVLTLISFLTPRRYAFIRFDFVVGFRNACGRSPSVRRFFGISQAPDF